MARVQGQCNWKWSGWVVIGFWQVSQSFQPISPHPTLLPKPQLLPICFPAHRGLCPSSLLQVSRPPDTLTHLASSRTGTSRTTALLPFWAEPMRAWMVLAVHDVPPATCQPLWEVGKEVLNEQMLVKGVPPAPHAVARLHHGVTPEPPYPV